MRINLSTGQKGALIGQNGSGKSYLAKHYLLPRAGRLLIIDPKGTFEFHDTEVFETADEIERRRPDRAIYRPRRSELRDRNAHEAIYNYAYERGETYVYTDELTAMVNGPEPPPSFLDCYARGRELGITMLTCSQRPSRVPIIVWSECVRFYVFRLVFPDDIKRIRQLLGKSYTGRPPTDAEIQRFAYAYGYTPPAKFAFTYWNAESNAPPRSMILRNPNR